MALTIEQQAEVDYLTTEIQLMEANLEAAKKLIGRSELIIQKRMRLIEFKNRLRELTD